MIEVSGDSCAVVVGPPTAVHPTFVDLVVCDGDDRIVIGRVRAEFDFSQVPTEFHAMILDHLARSGQDWYVGATARGSYRVIERIPLRRREPEVPASPVPWWKRLLTRWKS